jgi:hypothetical protein
VHDGTDVDWGSVRHGVVACSTALPGITARHQHTPYDGGSGDQWSTGIAEIRFSAEQASLHYDLARFDIENNNECSS